MNYTSKCNKEIKILHFCQLKNTLNVLCNIIGSTKVVKILLAGQMIWTIKSKSHIYVYLAKINSVYFAHSS